MSRLHQAGEERAHAGDGARKVPPVTTGQQAKQQANSQEDEPHLGRRTANPDADQVKNQKHQADHRHHAVDLWRAVQSEDSEQLGRYARWDSA
jgi:hypothetical protein